MVKKGVFYSFLVALNIFVIICILIIAKRFIQPLYLDNVSHGIDPTPQKKLMSFTNTDVTTTDEQDLYQYEEFTGTPYMELDEHGSWRNIPNTKPLVFFTDRDGRTINPENKILYTINKFGLRDHSDEASQVENKKFSAFLGCSFVFGVAVSDRETLPYYMSKHDPETHSYNFGVSGFGTNQVLHQFLTSPMKKIIKENVGDFFLIRIPQHTYRSFPHSSKTFQGRENTPIYEKNEEGLAHDLGPYQTVKPLSFLTDNLLKWVGLADVEPASRELQDYECLIIELLNNETKKLFPQSRFHVVYHPQYNHYLKYLRSCIKNKHINIIEFPQFSESFSKQTAIDRSHPSAQSNEALVKLFIEQLKKE